MNRSSLSAPALALALLTVGGAAQAADPPGAAGVGATVEQALKRWTTTAAHGIERGANAAVHGIKVGLSAAAHGIERGAAATARAADTVADKVRP